MVERWTFAFNLGFALRRAHKDPNVDFNVCSARYEVGDILLRLGSCLRPIHGLVPAQKLQRSCGTVHDWAALLE